MKKIILCLLIFPTMTFAAVGAQFNHYLSKPGITPSEDVLQFMRKHHVILVAGYMNEIEPVTKMLRLSSSEHGYLEYNKEVLNDLGIQASVHRPSSLETIEDSAEKLFENLSEYSKQGDNKPLLLIGHSRGGPVVMNLILNHPEVLKDKTVRRVVTVQSPVYGNSWPNLRAGRVLGRLWLPGEVGFLGMRALEPESIERAIGLEKFQSLSFNDQRRIDNSTLYVATSKDGENVRTRAEKKLARSYRKQTEILNDSLVPTENMWRPDYGFLIGYTGDLTHSEAMAHLSGIPSNEAKRLNRSFIYALMDALTTNIKGNRVQAQRISAAVKGSIGVEQPERPEPAPLKPSLVRECAILLTSLISG